MDSDLSRDAKHVGKTIFLHVSPAGDPAYPTVPTLAKECGMGVRSVQYALRELEHVRWITWELRGFKKWKWAARQYKLRYPDVEIDITAPTTEVHTMHPRGCTPRTAQEEKHREVTKPSPNPMPENYSGMGHDDLGTWFETFFAIFPNKHDKARAWRKLQQINPDDEKRALILEGLRRYLATTDRSATPQASTWLRSKGWREAIQRHIPWTCNKCGRVSFIHDGRNFWCDEHDPARPAEASP